ncbi:MULTISPECIES: RhuM family protein [Bacteroides]|jgi:prophage maintenance system killer protein|uniref:RhuM family protein n=1 Tax=Bacteroides zhangwenhongii TaxID=2650157 RepID=A0ABT5H4K0_9BACE|nr:MULTISPECIES: RhuM family protein [Bacteroides]MDC7135521.1 RhuM family protein [Bacteroides zhangwenhongii]SCI20963.1 Virulence protein [uncultured Bacteroides sp.]
MDNRGKIVIYQTKDGKTSIDVKLENETVWLTQAQMADLFQKDRTVIGRHINNVYREGELERDITCAKFAHMGSDNDQQYETAVYNLDVIISVGYRVKSQRGTQFRIWANKILKDYLIKGYAINQQVKAAQLADLKSTVRLLSNVIEHKQLTLDEANGLLRVITDYTYGLDTLDKYDYQQLEVDSTTPTEEFRATYEEAMEAIHLLQEKFGSSDLFGNEKDQSFKSSINTIYQTFGGEELYPSIEEKAAMLFYLVVKNHSFSDGNKRIAAFLFLWFLEKNGILYKSDGSKLIGNNTLVALTLMIAESRTEEKDVMVKVVINLINKNN